MGLCRNWYCTSGGSSCSGKHKLRCKAFSYGNPAFRGDQDNLRFFMASLLCTKVDFRKVVLATIVAVIHVGILVLSRDLGSAVIFFVTYLVLIYVATRNPSYLFLGLGGGCVGSVIAYHLFGHVRQRVSAWKDPMASLSK